MKLFFLLLAATFLSEDAALFSAGALTASGEINFLTALAACFVGIYAGDLGLFVAGRIFGSNVLKLALFRRFADENSIERAAVWFEKRGARAVFLSRFTPGFRVPVYFAAGLLKTNFAKFAFWLAAAAAVWTVLVVGFAAFFGSVAGENFFALSLFVVFSIVATRFLFKLTSWKNRRLFIGGLRRLKRWEFWNLKIFYLPILFYIFRLMIKHRSATVFTAANPGIEAGGFIGESKQAIYNNLAKSPAAQKHLLRFVVLSHELTLQEKLKIAADFIKRNKLDFPLAFKPNAGERGAGVFIVRSESELNARIETARTNVILQEYAAGDEFSVFYYRYPGEKRGRIFAVTEKRFPAVCGDGKATLETLILRDERAVCMAKSYFERHHEKLDFVPQAGESIELIDIGTHSRGAVFLDGAWAKTERLENKIDRICRGFSGFYFGRFDLKTDSIEDFRRGERFKIIELNGVTSEATNIYDPKNSLFAAYRVLFEQWRTAFEIGAENARRGCQFASALQLAALILENCFGLKRKSKIQNLKSKIQKCA